LVIGEHQQLGSLSSYCQLDGEQRFRAEIARITAAADVTGRWLAALQPLLRHLVDYDAAWLGRFDVDSGRYLALLEDGDVEPLRLLFADDVAAADIKRLGFLRGGWPRLGHKILPLLAQMPGWVVYLAPAGFRDGLGVGLVTEDGRHMGYLTLLTYRSEVVTATAAALLHAATPLIAEAVERAAPHDEPQKPEVGTGQRSS
jgi:hypothetical protein